MRYAVHTSYYIWADSDEDAILTAQMSAAEQQGKLDDSCSVHEVIKIPTGSITGTRVFPRQHKKLKQSINSQWQQI